MFHKTTLSLLLGTVAVAYSAQAEDDKIYNVPQDVDCIVRRADRVTYCTDKETGTPITGLMHKYRDGKLIRVYPMNNGVLDGVAVNYYLLGGIQSEKTYKNGVLDGPAKNYDEQGRIQSEEAYVSGKKEGVYRRYDQNGTMLMQAIYIGGKMNGDMRIYDTDGNTIYAFRTTQDKLVSGTYSFWDDDRITSDPIPPFVIEALNNKCLNLQTELTSSPCAVVFTGTVDGCNEKWRTENRQVIRKYLASCETGRYQQ